MTVPTFRPALYLGVFLLCGATLAYEIALTRVLSFVMWHHFTYVVIGVALLGFGAAGTYVTGAQQQQRWRRDPDATLARYSLAAGLLTPLSYMMMGRIVFEPLKIAAEPLQIVSLLLIYGVIALPFFFAGVAVCAAITFHRDRVGTVYFVDLLGAGAGALAAHQLIEPLGGPGLVITLGLVMVLAAACFWLSSCLSLGRITAGIHAGVAVVVAVLVGWLLLPAARAGKLDPPMVASKDMSVFQYNNLLEVSRWNPLARIDVSTLQNFPPMMGGVFKAGTPNHPLHAIFQDGAAPTMFIKWFDEPGRMDFLRTSTTGAGYPALRTRGVEAPDVMAIGVGGGVDLRIALAWGAKHVTGVEINDTIIELLRGRYAEFVGGLADRDDVEVVHAEGRHYARASGRKFDLIQLSGVDTYTALSSGAYALSESYLYTQEAVDEFLEALHPTGILSYSRFLFLDKPRETLRLAATAVTALEERGVADAHRCVCILYGDLPPYRWATVLIANQPFEPAALAAIRTHVTDNGFTMLFDPEQPASPTTAFDDCLRLEPDQRGEFYDRYPYEVRPARDERPFFFNFFKWSAVFQPGEYGGHVYRDTYPVGHLMLLVALVQTVLLGVIFILRPLGTLDRGIRDTTTWTTLLYFSALGVGFIALEIALIQRLVLFLGHPAYSLTLVLPTMLIAAGLGALSVGPRIRPRRRALMLSFVAPVMIALVWWLTHHGLDRFLDQSFAIRALIVIAMLTPVSLVLGMAFPTGIRLLGQHRPELVPWAWAINGFTSVLGSTGAVVMAMETGFSAVMIGVAVVYLLGFTALLWGFRPKVVGETPSDVVEIDEAEPEGEAEPTAS